MTRRDTDARAPGSSLARKGRIMSVAFRHSSRLTAAIATVAFVGLIGSTGLVGGCMYQPELDPVASSDQPIRDARATPEPAERVVFPRAVAPDPVDDIGTGFIAADDAGSATTPNAFGEFEGEGARPYLPVAGRAGYQQHTYVDEGFDTDVAVSPDARYMAFASTRHSVRSDIYLQRTNGLAVTKLTTDPADDAFPTFSPAGVKVAFCSNRAGNWDVYVMDRDGRNVTAVTQGPGHDLHPSFSPDGRRVVFSRIGGRSQQWELWVADLDTGEQTMIGFGLFPDWSPRTDRDVIAFQRARQRGGRWFSLWTLELSAVGEPTAVTEIAMSTNAALVAPAWSPDGTRLAFATVVDPEAGMADVDSNVGRQDIWTVNADGTDRHRITDGKGAYATPAWADDGRVYFVSDRGGTECVWSAPTDGQNFSTAAVPLAPRSIEVGPGATASTETDPIE
jgi:TolB protein